MIGTREGHGKESRDEDTSDKERHGRRRSIKSNEGRRGEKMKQKAHA